VVRDGGLGGTKVDQIALCIADDRPASSNPEWKAEEQSKETLRLALERTGMPEELQKIARRVDRVFEVGCYTSNSLQPWSKDGQLVLVGDAAHAMPPFLGQGANQAIQDAYSLASNLASADTVSEALAKYQRTRLPPTASLTLKSVLVGKLETQAGAGAVFRDALIGTLARIGVAKQIFLDGAAVRV